MITAKLLREQKYWLWVFAIALLSGAIAFISCAAANEGVTPLMKAAKSGDVPALRQVLTEETKLKAKHQASQAHMRRVIRLLES